MRLIRKLDDLPAVCLGGALTIGNFDGVHRGHQHIVSRLVEWARRVEGPATIFTFDPHPISILRPELAPTPLSWAEHKAAMLAKLHVDTVIAYPTDKELLSLTASEFFDQIVVQKLQTKAMVEGPNFFFGRDRGGNVDVLNELCAAADVQFEVVQPVCSDDELISSSRVRGLISAGEVQAAKEMLTHPYRIRGRVSHGAGRGSKIGIPTANLDEIETLLPADGVYAGRAFVENQQQPWPAAINIGPNPTFADGQRKVEAHLIGFDQSIYDSLIEIEFFRRIRDVRTFASVEELKAQLTHDINEAASVAAAYQ